MHHQTSIVPNLAAVRAAIYQNRAIVAEKRWRAVEALEQLARLTGKPLADLPADVPAIAKLIDDLDPKRIDASPELLALMKIRCRTAIALSRLVPGVVVNGGRSRMTPEWQAFARYIETNVVRNGLKRLMRWSSRMHIAPRKVDDALIDRFMADLRRTSERKHLYRVHRATTRFWNEMAASFPELGLQRVAVPAAYDPRKRVSIGAFPSSLLSDWEAFAAWARGDDEFATDMRPVRLASSSLDVMFRRIHLAANALVRSGAPIETIRNLSDLTSVEAFRSILSQRHKDVDGKATFDNDGMAQNLVLIAREWVKVSPEVLAKLKELKKKQPKPAFEMSEKNLNLVMKFDDTDLVGKFVQVPDKIWAGVQDKLVSGKRLSRTDLAQAQTAIGLAILMNMPIRLSNLRALAFGEHILIRDGMPSTLFLAQEDTKTFNNVEFEIPDWLVGWLVEYRDRIAPRVIGRQPSVLFANADGSLKGFMAVRYLVQRYLKLHLGLHVHPHAYRHLAAKFVLDDSPGAYRVVQELLGHKKLETSIAFYAGLNTRRAGELHSQLLESTLTQADAKVEDEADLHPVVEELV